MKTFRINRIISQAILIISFLGVFSHFSCAQERVDYSNPDITQEDMSAILRVLDIEMYKFGVNLPDSQIYHVCLYLTEFVDKEIIKEEEIWCTPSPYQDGKNKDGETIYKPFDGARFIVKEDKDAFWLDIRMGDFGYKLKVEIDSLYPYSHKTKRFKLDNTTLQEGKNPFLLIGSDWELKLQDGTTVSKFCMDELAPDFSDDAFILMPHYFIIGVNVIKKTE